MTGINLFSVQQAIKQYLKDSIPLYSVESGATPTAESLPIVDGILEPLVILRFSDMMPSAGEGSFNGALYSGYYSYVDALCVGQTDDDARELAGIVNSFMLGKVFPNAGELRKNYGGGQFAIVSEAGRQPVAFVAVTSYRYIINMEDVGAGSRLA